MKLSKPQISQVVGESGATVIPEDHPAASDLETSFGDHTFFVDTDGLHVWDCPSDTGSESSKLVGMRIASWSSEDKDSLVPHEPVPTQVIEDPS